MTTKELRRVWSDTPVSPGSILRYELDARGMSEDELSVQAGCELSDVSGVVHGDLVVTSEFAMKLESVLGIRAQIWLNLQERYDLTLARNEDRGNATLSTRCLRRPRHCGLDPQSRGEGPGMRTR